MLVAGTVAFHILAFSVLDGLRGLARFGVGSLALSVAAVALVISTTSIASERESRALSLLKLSQLSAAEILLGKILGISRFLGPAIALPMVPAAFLLALDGSAFLLTAVLVGVLFPSACAVGLSFSTLFRQSSTALTGAFAATIAWLGFVQFLAWLAPGDFGRVLLAFANPLFSVGSVTSGFATDWRSEYRDPYGGYYRDRWDWSQHQWVGWAGIIAIALIGAIAFLIAGWRLETEEGDA